MTLVLLATAAVAFTAVTLSVDPIRWRTKVVVMKASGRVTGIDWPELLTLIRPGSPVYLKGLVETPNAYAVIVNPFAFAPNTKEGSRLFQMRCASCHGEKGGGGTAPSLIGRKLKFGDSDWSLYKSIVEGRLEVGMPPAEVTGDEAWHIAAYVRGLRNGWSALEAQTTDVPAPRVDLTPDRIENAGAEPENWLTYSGSYSSWRHSGLDEVTTENVTDLRLAWVLQMDTAEPFVETTPIVVDGAMFLTTPDGNVIAADTRTGNILWRYHSATPADVPVCCGFNNRGVAVVRDRVIIGTLDTRVVALDARTGEVRWQTTAADYRKGYSMTGAPLAVGDKVIVGMAGGDYATRGFLDAYDVATGKRVWRFYTIPAPGEPGSETWGNDAWKTGGGATWVTGSYDPELRLVYWGVGNPAPDFFGDARPGDNLYTNSVVALDVDTGKLRWHFQFTPHDEHDWDANQIPVLVDREFGGERRRLMLWGNRNGFYYVLDRETGEFLHATPFVKQTWAEGVDANGRPIVLPDSAPSMHGTLTWPGLSGGGNWWSPSYSPLTDLVYIPFAESPKIFFKDVDFDPTPVEGQPYMGSASVATGEPLQAGVRALDPATGEIRWQYMRSRPDRRAGWMGGVLSTAGNVAFVGDLRDFVAFDSATGRELWRVNLGGYINAAPISFAVDGRQHVAIPAGNALYVFRL